MRAPGYPLTTRRLEIFTARGGAAARPREHRPWRERLRSYELKTILVEAGVPDVWAHHYRSKTMPQAVIASALAIEQDYGISTTWAGSRESAEKIAALILSRFHRKRAEGRDAR